MSVIAVDVDLTVCGIDILWWNWLCSVTNSKYMPMPKEEGKVNYNLSKYFEDKLEKVGRDGLDFFRQEGVYDFAPVIKDSEQVLKYLKGQGHEIVFVSAVKGNHHKSKYNFLKRHFPFMDGFVATKEKNYVNCDIIIDDRNVFLNKVTCDTKIKFYTPYQQCEELKNNKVLLVKSWFEVMELFKKNVI